MANEPHEPQLENEDQQTEADPAVREIAEGLDGWKEYQREQREERGLTFGDW